MTIKKRLIVLCSVLSLLLSSPISFRTVQAESASDLLQQQQELTAKINKNRSAITNLKADIARLNSKIKANKVGLVENARAVQVANPSSSMISMILSSRSIPELLEQIVSINMLVDTANAQTKDLEKVSKQEKKALSELNTAQVELDQSQQALTVSLQEYLAKQEPPVKFTPKSEQPQTTPSSSSSKTPNSSSTPSAPSSSSSSSTPTPPVPSLPADEAQARANIVARESGGNYTARNGNYYGAYQLDISYLNGDLSPANQDRVAQAYVTQRYGSWVNAWAFWQTHHWY